MKIGIVLLGRGFKRAKIKQGRKKAKDKLHQEKKNVWCTWKAKWEAEAGEGNFETFFQLFEATYEYVLCAKTDNKMENFRWKKKFLRLFVLGGAAFVFFFVYNLCFDSSNQWMAWLENGVITLLMLFISSIISKWVDIKKYQETWARHSWHLHSMNTEMVRFISDLEPYHRLDKKRVFVDKILEIWDKNQEKFVHNMEDKEKELMDIAKYLKE